jgi:tetratricopeptide (TPR) repeat protein
VIQLDPTLVRAHFELGLTLAQLGRPADAVEEFRKVVAAEPKRSAGHINLVRALLLTNRDADCIAACRAGLQAVPSEPFLQHSLAWMLATAADAKLRNGAEALEIGRRLCDASKRQDLDALQITAAALAETGDFDNAAKCVSEAMDLVRAHPPKSGTADSIAELERCRALYQSGRSYRKGS